MLFSSNVFIFVFLPVVITIYYLVLHKKTKYRNVFLFIASLAFYAWGGVFYALLMLSSITVNYWVGRIISEKAARRKMALVVGICVNVSVLFVFKYLGFAVRSFNVLLRTDIPYANLALPIGISFYTFQGISYLVDVYRGEGKAQKNFLDVGLYISFFPQLIAGPIVRYAQIEDQLHTREHTVHRFAEGIERFLYGLGKKVLLANNLALVADNAFLLQQKGQLSVLMAWLGCIAYTLQIYYDFAGYSDMAIGLGKMFGFELPENFNYPYISKTIAEFWRRWHMTLQGWYRDYVYIPLGGNRVSKRRHLFNLFVVWGLTGLWHGANWTFIVWGLLYFVLITGERIFHMDKLPSAIGRLLTLFFVMVGWVIFRSDSLRNAAAYIGIMFARPGTVLADYNGILYIKEYFCFFVFGILFSFPIYRWIREKMPNVKYIAMLLLWVLSVSYMVRGTYNPFIYFNF